MTFAPANELTSTIKDFAAEIFDGAPPRWAMFPRWYRNGDALWLESSSGSRLLTVDFAAGVIRIAGWHVERTGCDPELPIPPEWQSLIRASQFHSDGSAVYPDDFDAAIALPVRG